MLYQELWKCSNLFEIKGSSECLHLGQVSNKKIRATPPELSSGQALRWRWDHFLVFDYKLGD